MVATRINAAGHKLRLLPKAIPPVENRHTQRADASTQSLP